MTAISRNLTKIWIIAADAHPSTLSANVWSTSNTSGYISGQILGLTKGGGEVDSESVPVFGGFVDKEKPATQFEIEFSIVPALESSSFNWESLAYTQEGTTGIYTSKNATLADKAVFIQGNSGSAYKSWGFNNCNVVVLDQEHPADDNATQTLRMKFSPTTGAGLPNFQTGYVAASALTLWSSLTA